MFRTHGRPDLLREEEAIDELGARIRRLRSRMLRLVIGISFATAAVVTLAAASIASEEAGPGITGKALGAIFGTLLFGTMVGGYRLGATLVLRRALGWARDLSRDRRCDEEPLLDAARLFAGGQPS